MAEIPTNRFTKIYLTIWGVCILVGVITLILYKFGFRVDNQLTPVRVSAIELSSNESDFQIFLNNREKNVAQVEGVYILKNITPGLHSIVISKEGFWPWTKTVAVNENNVRSLYAFMFPMEGITTEALPSNSTEYTSALNLINSSRLPLTKAGSVELLPSESVKVWIDTNVPDRRISHNKNTALYIQDNTIYVAWISETEPPPHYFCEENPCKLIIPVIVASGEIKSVDFYKDRDDVIIFTAGGVIYGIEADHEGTQNFQPLFKGANPHFYKKESDILYIQDGKSIVRADL
ncbi:MAG: hypothetical protein AAB511_03875 [Patescibacteria group bacterium]